MIYSNCKIGKFSKFIFFHVILDNVTAGYDYN